MIVSTHRGSNQPVQRHEVKRPVDDENAISGMIQNSQMPSVQRPDETSQIKEDSSAIPQVNAKSQVEDNVEEAFAKTRVTLQSSDGSKSPSGSKANPKDSAAMAEFKDYMSKSPEQRMRDSILKEMGLTEDEVKAMPPEKQAAIENKIAQLIENKMKLELQAEKSKKAPPSSCGEVENLITSLSP
jgi:hypothetical protein